MLCASLPVPMAAQCLLQHTRFLDNLITQLCLLYGRLPTVMDPGDIQSVHAKWGYDA